METIEESKRKKDRMEEIHKDTEMHSMFINAQWAEDALKTFLINYPVHTRPAEWIKKASYGMLAYEVRNLAWSETVVTDLARSACAFIKPRIEIYHHLFDLNKSFSDIKMGLKESSELPSQLAKGVNQILEDIEKLKNNAGAEK